MDVGLSEEQRETLHPIKGVEMMNTLMEAVHAVLMLDTKQANIFTLFHSARFIQPARGAVTAGGVYLRQAAQDGGAAGRAAAHRGEGLLKYQATLSQGAKVRGADHRVVVHLCLKASIVSWKREDESIRSCVVSTPAGTKPTHHATV